MKRSTSPATVASLWVNASGVPATLTDSGVACVEEVEVMVTWPWGG